MRARGARAALLVAAVIALATAGSAFAQDAGRGIDPNQGESLVEVHLDSKAEAIGLQLKADDYDIDFNDHYLRHDGNGGVTVTVFGTAEELDALEAAGYNVGRTIEGPATWRDRAADWQATAKAESRADAAALAEGAAEVAPRGDIIVLRVDYFENYAGRFLSVEAKDGTRGSATTGASLALSWNTGLGTPIDQGPRTMNVNIDPDTTPDTYVEHRILVKVGEAATSTPLAPTRIRIGSSLGAFVEADVNPWLGGGLPPMSSNYLSNFTTRYLDPTELYNRFRELAAEFPDLTTIIPLPYKTNGYQRRAQALMAGLTNPAFTGNLPGATGTQAVILTSRAWGHEGGNDLTAEFVNPGVSNSPLAVTMTGNDLRVSLGTGPTGALTSTAAQVATAINANADAFAKLVAQTYRGNAGGGIVQPRIKGNLSDFLDPNVQHGPFEYFVMRIGKNRPGNSEDQGIHGRRVGVFLYCQQHAREWATPLTCLETAEQLLRNYGIDKTTRQLVDELDIFILPASNPDGAHYSMHNFSQQRRTMTNWCMVGGLETDDANAANFWTPRPNALPGGGAQPFNDSAARNAWGVDMNRNNTFGTLSDGYIGASPSCVSDVFAGPVEASEPEIKNELWIADTFKNIKFSNNIHSFGGYFMWAPGTYLPDRGEGDAVHANIGVEKYFFQAGDKILNRIKEVRNTAILPERTGPIADVLYSAAGNSADEHWYNRGVIAYSFETGADRFGGLEQTTVSVTSAAGTKSVRSANRNLFTPFEKVTFDPGLATEETRTVESVSATNPPGSAPNIFFTEPLQFAHAAGAVMRGEDLTQLGVGFQPDYATEGRFEALEFAAGNRGLLESAYEYSKDDKGPEVIMTGARSSSTPITTTFQYVSEPAVIRYTTDGSKPDSTSTLWDSTGPREPGQSFVVTKTTEFRWLATDMAGNQTTGRAKFEIR
jgi:zinc carboxypeptidase/chitobiase/beta-hexosaminidase-like protein